ncbi:MAG: hypothetical protein U0R80_01205 [Nocardioidaceae bacterium]
MTISGRVLDQVTGDPVPAAVVQVWSESSYHGEEAWAHEDVTVAPDGTFDYVEPGTCFVPSDLLDACATAWMVRVTVPGAAYVPRYPGDSLTWPAMSLTGGAGDHLQVGDIHLTHGGGTVLVATAREARYDDSTAVPTLVDVNGDPVGVTDAMQPLDTDPDQGRFAVVDVPPGDYWLRADTAHDRAWFGDSDPSEGGPATVHVADASTVTSLDPFVVREQLPTVDPGELSLTEARVGELLTVDYGPTDPVTVTTSFAFTVAGQPWDEGGPSTLVASELLGLRFKVGVAMDGDGHWPFRTTLTSTRVRPGLSTLARPRVRGDAVVGQTLTARSGDWTPACVAAGRCETPDVHVRFHWLRDGTVIPGATSAHYVVRRADRGHVLRVRTRATSYGYEPVASRSSALPVGRR